MQRLKTFEEEKGIQWTTGYAIIVYKPFIPTFTGVCSIPKYLKRIKSIDSFWAYLLISVGDEGCVGCVGCGVSGVSGKEVDEEGVDRVDVGEEGCVGSGVSGKEVDEEGVDRVDVGEEGVDRVDVGEEGVDVEILNADKDKLNIKKQILNVDKDKLNIDANSNKTLHINKNINKNKNIIYRQDIIKIKVPGDKPYTQSHYNEYKKMWPCIFHKKVEPKLDVGYVLSKFELISIESLYGCSGECYIDIGCVDVNGCEDGDVGDNVDGDVGDNVGGYIDVDGDVGDNVINYIDVDGDVGDNVDGDEDDLSGRRYLEAKLSNKHVKNINDNINSNNINSNNINNNINSNHFNAKNINSNNINNNINSNNINSNHKNDTNINNKHTNIYNNFTFKTTDNILGHAIYKAIDTISKHQIGYLCTGMDVYVLTEPCLSCAMVLVHGRIRRVFCKYKRVDGVWSKFKFCYNKELNHRYEVYFCE